MICEIYNIEISGKDLYPIWDFNKNNFIIDIPQSEIICSEPYGVGKLSTI